LPSRLARRERLDAEAHRALLVVAFRGQRDLALAEADDVVQLEVVDVQVTAASGVRDARNRRSLEESELSPHRLVYVSMPPL
jgi:hypothetical protein